MNDQLFYEIGQRFTDQFDTTVGQIFGKPCLKTNKKAFVAFFKGEMVFKLGQQQVNLLLEKYPSSNNWDPSGKDRPMKDWLQIPADYCNDWEKLTEQALEYVEEHK